MTNCLGQTKYLPASHRSKRLRKFKNEKWQVLFIDGLLEQFMQKFKDRKRLKNVLGRIFFLLP